MVYILWNILRNPDLQIKHGLASEYLTFVEQ